MIPLAIRIKMMKMFTIAAAAFFAIASAQAKPLEEELATNLTSSTLKTCFGVYNTDKNKRTYNPDEINNLCSCYSVTIINLTTQEEYDAWQADGKWPNDMKQKREADRYCQKYLNLPDASAIRKKKW